MFPTAAATNFNAKKLDLNALMGKKRGTIPTFLSSVTSDAIGSSTQAGSYGAASEESALARNGEPLFSFFKTAHKLNVNSYLRENRINMPLVRCFV